MQRAVVTWTGFPGAPGYSSFYFTDDNVARTELHDFFESLKTMFPQNVKIQVPGSGDTIDPLTGDITGSWSDTAPAVVIGTNTTVYAGPVGAVVNWRTDTYRDGGPSGTYHYRVRGRTFLVPLASAVFDLDGSLTSGVHTGLNTAVATFRTAVGGDQLIWHRPPKGSTTGGQACSVTGASVPDRAAVMRSRRA